MARFPARFSGSCAGCGGAIAAGEMIDYRGKGTTRHVACAGSASAAPAGRPRFRAYTGRRSERGCHTDGNCSSVCRPATCPCGDGGWFRCC